MENKKGEGTPDDMLKLKLLLEATWVTDRK